MKKFLSPTLALIITSLAIAVSACAETAPSTPMDASVDNDGNSPAVLYPSTPIASVQTAPPDASEKNDGMPLIPPQTAISGESYFVTYDFTASPANGNYIQFCFQNTTSEKVAVHLYRKNAEEDIIVKAMSVGGGSQNQAVFYDSIAGSGTYFITIEAIESGGTISGNLSVDQYTTDPTTNPPDASKDNDDNRPAVLYPSTPISGAGGFRTVDFTASPANGNYIRFWFSNTTNEKVHVYLIRKDSEENKIVGFMSIGGDSQDQKVYYDSTAGSGTYYVKIEAVASGGIISGNVSAAQYTTNPTTNPPDASKDNDDNSPAVLYPSTPISDAVSYKTVDFTASPANGNYIRFWFSNTTSEKVHVYLIRKDSEEDKIVGFMSIGGDSQDQKVYYDTTAGSGTYFIMIEAVASGGTISGNLSVNQYTTDPTTNPPDASVDNDGNIPAVLYPSGSISSSRSGSFVTDDFTATPANGNYIQFCFQNTTSEKVAVHLFQTDSGTDKLVKSMYVEGDSQNQEVYYSATAGSGTYYVKIEAVASGGIISGDVSAAQYKQDPTN